MLICRTKTGYSEHIRHMYKQQITVVFVLFNVVEEQDKQKSGFLVQRKEFHKVA